MKYLKSIDESFLDIFKSKSAKRLNFTEDELQFIISRVGNLINNFDAHHVNGDVSTKHMVPRKAKKEYSRIFLNMRAYYSKFEYGKLELSKYRKWSGNKFKVVYHMLSPIDYESIHQFTDGIIKQIIMWYLSVILNETFSNIKSSTEEYGVIRGGKISEFRFREMFEEICENKLRKLGSSRRDPLRNYSDDYANDKIRSLKELNIEFIK